VAAFRSPPGLIEKGRALVSLDGPGVRDSWFLILPDSESARPVVAVIEAVQGRQTQIVDHPSGRPWLLGSWAQGEIVAGRAGDAKVALVGQHAVPPPRLEDEASRLRTVDDLGRFAASMVGSSHLIASVAGRVRVQGTVTGVRRVFHAVADGVAVAADRADVLAALLHAGFDEELLALHLMEPHILFPLAGQPVWRGVAVLRGDHYLVLDGDRAHRSVRWWTPPDPVVPMADGAPALRDALSAAVEARVRGRELVSCDLGGLDSTALCSLAARGDAKVIAFTAASPDPLADDVAWARKTVMGLAGVDHEIIPAEEMPLVFHGLASAADDVFDEPCTAIVDRDRWLIIARRAAARGSGLHLAGFGGDELLYGSIAHLHELVRTKPRIGLRNLRGFAAKYRWPRPAVLRQLADSRPYPRWLASVADTLTAPPPPPQEPLLEWGFRPRLPPWTLPDAVRAVRDRIRADASSVDPLASGRGQHRELEAMRFVSRLTRQFGQMAGRLGLTLAAPYYDDRVVEAGLAVRPEERVTPWRYKPLILEAMRGIIPADSLLRQTKANGSGDEEPGLRRHRAELLALWEDSRLGRLGLVDVGPLRELCRGPLPPGLGFGALDQTVACEVWLRSLETATTAAPF
jgi:asparagine synthase (glutamine-hydrolysing)